MRSTRSTIQRFNDSTITIANRQRTRKVNRRVLKQIAEALFAELKIQAADLEINLVAAGEMARLNEKYLRHAGSTDVIAFDYTDHNAARLVLHGEIFICVDEAIAQARQFRTSWQSEIVRYLVHGVLHLTGHDDLQPEKRQKMKRAENHLLRRLSRRFSLAQLARATKLPA